MSIQRKRDLYFPLCLHVPVAIPLTRKEVKYANREVKRTLGRGLNVNGKKAVICLETNITATHENYKEIHVSR